MPDRISTCSTCSESIRVLEQQPHSKMHRADSDVTRRVTTEIAYGYKIVIAHSVGKKSLFGKNKDVVKAVQRAMLFLSYSLLHS